MIKQKSLLECCINFQKGKKIIQFFLRRKCILVCWDIEEREKKQELMASRQKKKKKNRGIKVGQMKSIWAKGEGHSGAILSQTRT